MRSQHSNKKRRGRTTWPAILLTFLLATACAQAQSPTGQPALPLHPITLANGERLQVIATTSVLGDVVKQVGGDAIVLTVLMQAGQDPHSYEPAASTAAIIEQSHVVFTNGFDLEESLLPLLDSAFGKVAIVSTSEGVEPISVPELTDHGGIDPHVWQDPQNVMIWTNNIAKTLIALDPAHRDVYNTNVKAYIDELADLDVEIEQRLLVIPTNQRKLVTNHDSLGYFARRYDFEVIGTVYLGTGEAAEPSAGQMAQLVETIRAEDVNAIFVETTITGQLAQTVADEVGRPIAILTLFTDALGNPDTSATTYLGMMRANCDSILEGLSP